MTFDELRSIVAEDDKQRFSLIPQVASEAATSKDDPIANDASISAVKQQAIPSDDPKDYLIRANQGHSLAVESEGLLTPIIIDDLPETVVHGTTHGAWPLIVASGGLKCMTRTHVHFASGLPAGFTSLSKGADDAEAQPSAAAPVISGMRNSSTVLVFVNIRKAIEGGLKFWRSENGVILSEGDDGGLISLQYFHRVEDRSLGHGVLVEDGQIVKDAPESWTKKGNGQRGGRGGNRGRGRGGRDGQNGSSDRT